MRAIKYRELKRMYESAGPQRTCDMLGEALEKKTLKPEDFSIRELAEATLGAEAVRDMDPRNGGGRLIREASDGVDSTAFSNITGQIVGAKVLESYQQEAFVLSNIIPAIPTRLNGERMIGLGQLGDPNEDGDQSALTVHEGMPYPSRGFGEDYQDTPATTKRGLIVPVTKEAVFFDLTGQVLQRAGQVGEVLGLNKEKMLLDLLIGYTNNYKWLGTTYDTYSADGHTGDNGGTVVPSRAGETASESNVGLINKLTNTLNDWTDIQEAELAFSNIVDPNTGEPILPTAAHFICTPALWYDANRIFNATEVRTTTGSSKTQTNGPNPLRNSYQCFQSRLLASRLVARAKAANAAAAAKFWFLGDLTKAFAWMENWPITVVQAPSNSEAEFNQDIVARYKASERGVGAVMNPRFILESTGAS